MIGRAISHYRVLSSLGSGGMGVVYLAEDERLGRQVALKFLPPESAASHQALERFRVEARAASSLSHPGICAIFDIGDDQGTPYIVMEALKGESLRDRINRGPLKVADLLDIAIQLADALDAAHAQGIIHRDIKPSNIFIGDKNRTKILDFGLAKLAQAAGPISSGAATRALYASTHRDLTMPGSALGTVSYMSPEQARGEAVDTRTDLFSLGVVLYEMATGIQAFGGSTQAIVFDAILNRTPHPITHINPLIPPRLESVIVTALEKDRELRHQHASDLEAELKRIRRDLESGSLAAATRTQVTPAADRRSGTTRPTETAPAKSRSWMWVAVGALVIALALAGFNLWSDTASQVAVAPAAEQTPVAPPVQTSPPAPSPAAAEPEPAPPAAQPKPQAAVPPARPTPQPQPQQPARPATDPRPQTSQPSVTPTPQRPPQNLPAPESVTATTPPPSLSPSLPPPPEPTATAAPPPAQPPAPAATQPQTPATQPPATQPPPTQPPSRSAATPPAAVPTVPPASPVESDDALVRGVIRTYERAIETKNVDLFRSVWPGLSAAEESRLRTSFSQVDSQQVEITVDELRIEGRTATVRISRRDTIMSSGRRQNASSRQTLRLEKAAAGWIITEIR
jgi:serine/threonine protein kinase